MLKQNTDINITSTKRIGLLLQEQEHRQHLKLKLCMPMQSKSRPTK